MDSQIEYSIMEIVRACDAAQVCTFGLGVYPDTRHLVNTLNRNILDLNLYFVTTKNSPKYQQILKNPHACVYYFNPENRHVVRLYGEIEIVIDENARRMRWVDEFKQYGYTGPDDKKFALLHFTPEEYKFYIGDELKTGKITE